MWRRPRRDRSVTTHLVSCTTESFTDLVEAAYRALLNREPDAPGLQLYVSKLASLEMSPSDLLNALASSPEYAVRQRATSYSSEHDHVFNGFVTSQVIASTDVLLSQEFLSLQELKDRLRPFTNVEDPYFTYHGSRFREIGKAIAYATQQRQGLSGYLLDFGGTHATAILAKELFGDIYLVANADLVKADWLDRFVYSQFVVNLESSCLETTKLGDTGFDVILFCEVLEHLRSNPLRIFQFLIKNLREGGYIYLTTPNFYREYNVSAFRDRLAMQPVVPYEMSQSDLHSHHVREYCAKEIFEYASRVGLSLVCFYFSDCWDDPAAAVKAEERANMVFLFQKGSAAPLGAK